MARTGSQGFISIFLLIVSLVGAVGGVAIGYGLDGVVPSRRLLAVLAALCAIVVVVIVRSFLGASFPSLFLRPKEAVAPLASWLIIGFSVILGSLAAHDLSALARISSGPLVGFLSGTLAAMSMATLIIIYFHEHPKGGIEF